MLFSALPLLYGTMPPQAKKHIEVAAAYLLYIIRVVCVTTSLRHPRAVVIFVLFVAGHFLSTFFRSANAVIAPDLSRDLGLTADQLGLMTSLFYASFALA